MQTSSKIEFWPLPIDTEWNRFFHVNRIINVAIGCKVHCNSEANVF